MGPPCGEGTAGAAAAPADGAATRPAVWEEGSL